jgi:hypothetical protein
MPDERVSPQLRGTKQAKRPAARCKGGGDFARTVMQALLGFHFGFWDIRAHWWLNCIYPINF